MLFYSWLNIYHMFLSVFSDPPSKPEVYDVTKTSVSIRWSIPFNDGGSKIVGYVVERRAPSDDEETRWLKCNYTTITENFFTITSLHEGEEYEFRVIARNGAGVHSMPSESTGLIACKDEYSKMVSLIHACLQYV